MTQTAKRPSTARKDTRTTDAKRDDELDTGMAITVDGVRYEARVGDVTPQLARELRQATGGGFLKLMDALVEDTDIDLVSAWVWLARRIDGEHGLALSDVVVTYSQLLADGFDVAVAGKPGEEDEDRVPEQ